MAFRRTFASVSLIRDALPHHWRGGSCPEGGLEDELGFVLEFLHTAALPALSAFLASHLYSRSLEARQN